MWKILFVLLCKYSLSKMEMLLSSVFNMALRYWSNAEPLFTSCLSMNIQIVQQHNKNPKIINFFSSATILAAL